MMSQSLKYRKWSRLFAFTAFLSCAAVLVSCRHGSNSVGAGEDNAEAVPPYSRILADTISSIVSGYPGEIGVAVIIDNRDTVAVNNGSIYPMMSVFKLHQAIAVCNEFDRRGLSLDSLMTIRRDELNPETWSPMMEEHAEPVLELRVAELLQYTLAQSDNNASNLMFERLVGIAETDSLMATLIPRPSFRIAHTEAEMAADHAKAYENYTSPLGAAMLMNRLFSDSLLSSEKQSFIMETLRECETGKDRILAPLLGERGVAVAHKTGSGYRNAEGILAAHNDVAFITLPDGCYTLSVFVKDFKGDESQASKAIAHISAVVYSILAH